MYAYLVGNNKIIQNYKLFIILLLRKSSSNYHIQMGT